MNRRVLRALLAFPAIALLLLAGADPCRALTEARQVDLTALGGVRVDPNDEFGHAVAVDGDIAVVGVPKDDVSGTNSGAAYVFVRSGTGVWSRQMKLWANEPGDQEHFGWSVAVDATHEIIVVGAPYEDSSAHRDRGAVYVFRPGTTQPWDLVDKLEAHRGTTYDGDDRDHFGSAVAVRGDTIVVGAPDEDVGFLSTDQGAVYVFRNPTSNQWASATKLTSDYRDENARFGYAVATDGDTIAIGEPFRDCAGDTNRGGVHFYDLAAFPTHRSFQCAPAGSPADHLGSSVAVEGTRAMVGAPDDGLGRTYPYEKNAGAWSWSPPTRLQPVLESFVAGPVKFGQAVAVYDASDSSHAPHFVSRFVAVVGAPDENAANQYSLPADIGAAYVFAWEPLHDWTLHAKLREPETANSDRDTNDHFGHAVAVSAPNSQRVVVLVGAPQDNIGLLGDTGGAYLFEFEESDFDGDGVADAVDNCYDTPNPQQRDEGEYDVGLARDGVGDLCDNCLRTHNPDQENWDEDELGNACDECDRDGYNWSRYGCDNCGDDDRDRHWTRCDRYDEDREFDHCDDDTDNWTYWACRYGCRDADSDDHYVDCDRYEDRSGPDCDDADDNNWTSRGCAQCVDEDGDGHFLFCDRYDILHLGPDCNDGNAAINLDAPDAICDGVDNNCDGVEDNGRLAITCGFGVCARGGWLRCEKGQAGEPDEQVTECTPGTATGDDADCNGIDEDCDGFVDNHYLGEVTSCGIGACESAGRFVCENGAVVDSCTEGDPSAEVCDGIDNDCDRSTDEDASGTVLEQDCYTGAAGTRDVGICVGGLQTCADGRFGACNGEITPTDEACDGLDNDCDGREDDELVAPAADLTAGVCAGSLKRCAGANGWVEPDYAAIPGFEADEVSCDFLDNDCDQTIDEEDIVPVIECPADVVPECGTETTPAATGSAAATDNCRIESLGFEDSAVPGCGETTTITRSWSAVDQADNRASCAQTIAVTDTTPPTVDPPAPLTAECSIVGGVSRQDPAVARWLGQAGGEDRCGGVTLGNDAPPAFRVGETPVSFTAVDECDNTASAASTLTVVDTTTPQLTPPADVAVECASASGTPVELGQATSSDTCCGSDVAVSSDAPGAFPLGASVVTWTAEDCNGRVTTSPQAVQVVDTTKPAGGITAPVGGACHGPRSLPVTVTDSFTDVCDADLERVYEPGPGPAYATHGDFNVALTVRDDSGNPEFAAVAFTIDLVAPTVEIVGPPSGTVVPDDLAFDILFWNGDDDGAGGPVLHERVLLDGCVIYDGSLYGDRDGLLSDETLRIDMEELCRVTAPCGLPVWDRPELRVEATDCGGNTGSDARRLGGSIGLRPGACGF